MQIQKPTDLDLHCLQRQSISGFSRTRVKTHLYISTELIRDTFAVQVKTCAYYIVYIIKIIMSVTLSVIIVSCM